MKKNFCLFAIALMACTSVFADDKPKCIDKDVKGEQTYTVTYTERTSEKRDPKHKDVVGEYGTYQHDQGKNTVVSYAVYNARHGWIYTNNYEIVDGKYVVDRFADWYYVSNVNKITIITEETVTKKGVKETELSQYENKTGFEKTGEKPEMTTVYKVTSGITSKEVTASELAMMDEEDILKQELVSGAVEGQDALYDVVIKGHTESIMSNDKHEVSVTEKYNAWGSYYETTYPHNYYYIAGNRTYSTDKGTLKFEDGKWKYKGGMGGNPWYTCGYNNSVNIYYYVEDETLKDVKDISEYSDKSKYIITKTQDAVEAQDAVYRVYVNGTTTTDVYGYNIGDGKAFSEITNALSNAKSALEGLNTTISDGDTKLGNLNDAIKRLNASNEKLNEAQAAYDAISGNNASLKAQKIEAEKNLQDAKDEKAKAEKAYQDAKKALESANSEVSKAKKALDKVDDQIRNTQLDKWRTENEKKSIENALSAAKNEVAAWADKINRATKLAEKTDEARRQAEEARDAIKNIKASNLGAEALAKAKAELEAAEAALAEAEGLAEQALKDAENAQAAYEAAVKRVNDLIAEENRRAEEERREREERERREREEAERLAEEERLAAEAALLAAQAVPVQAVVAAAPAAVAEEVEAPEVEEVAEVEIEDEETALADAPETEETEIVDEEAPLASMEEQAKMSWWWILIVLALGTTGAELYRRHMVKKNAEKVEK